MDKTKVAQDVPDGWLRAIDEALVVHHVGIADASDSYDVAKDKLNSLLCCAQDIGALHATQPAEQSSGVAQGEYRADIPDGAADCLIDSAKVDDFHPDGSQRERLRDLVRLAAFEGQARMAPISKPAQDAPDLYERAGFEADLRKRVPFANLNRAPVFREQYAIGWVQQRWFGWQARAALSRPDDTELLRELLKAIDLWELDSPVAYYEIKRLHPILSARLNKDKQP